MTVRIECIFLLLCICFMYLFQCWLLTDYFNLCILLKVFIPFPVLKGNFVNMVIVPSLWGAWYKPVYALLLGVLWDVCFYFDMFASVSDWAFLFLQLSRLSLDEKLNNSVSPHPFLLHRLSMPLVCISIHSSKSESGTTHIPQVLNAMLKPTFPTIADASEPQQSSISDNLCWCNWSSTIFNLWCSAVRLVQSMNAVQALIWYIRLFVCTVVFAPEFLSLQTFLLDCWFSHSNSWTSCYIVTYLCVY